MSWAVEFSQYKIQYEPCKAIKAQVLPNFLAEMTLFTKANLGEWTIYVDGSSNAKGCKARVIIENIKGVLVEHSLMFEFPTSKNQAEYKDYFGGIREAKELGVSAITSCSRS